MIYKKDEIKCIEKTTRDEMMKQKLLAFIKRAEKKQMELMKDKR
jgi:hypothetical protein